MPDIRVVVHGVNGKMGAETANAVCRESGMALTAAVSRSAQDASFALPDGSGTVPLSRSIDDAISVADVVADFTSPEGAMAAIRAAAAQNVHVVTGTTGLSDADLEEVKSLAEGAGIGIIVAPNFALGAVLMIHLAREAGRFFDYAELTEVHHEAKVDAPSGTALAIARAAVQGKKGHFIATKAEKETLGGTRGGVLDGVSIHSGRMQGRVAHHELVFGTLGQTLTIRHDSINRESFMPGVVMAIREVADRPGLTLGLENVLGL